MKPYWISFKQNFTDYSEGHSLKEAVERLGMTLDDTPKITLDPIPIL